MAKVFSKSSVTRKEYNYELKNVRLIFTLRTDNTDELIAYKHLLQKGLEDVDIDIKEIQAKRKSKR